MRKITTTCGALMILNAYSVDAYGLYLYNRSGSTLCAAATRDEPDPFDQDVSRITEGWDCVDDFGTLVIEPSDGILGIAVKKTDGTDYVASSCLAFERTKSFVPKDNDNDVFGVEVLKFTTGGVAYSWHIRGVSVRVTNGTAIKQSAMLQSYRETWTPLDSRSLRRGKSTRSTMVWDIR